jgi:hypothetical protein
MRSVSRRLSSAPQELSSALSLVSLIAQRRNLRQCTNIPGASIYLAIYTSRLSTNLPNKVVEFATNAGLPVTSTTDLLTALGNGTTTAYEQVPGSNAGVIAAIEAGTKSANASSLSIVYLASLAFAGTALVSAVFYTDVSQYLTNFVNKKVDGKSTRVDQVKDVDMKHEV